MKQFMKWLVLLGIVVTIWSGNVLAVWWDDIPLTGDEQVFCTVDGVLGLPITYELRRITWEQGNTAGLFAVVAPFLEPFYIANCRGYINGQAYTLTASAIGAFNGNPIYMPGVEK